MTTAVVRKSRSGSRAAFILTITASILTAATLAPALDVPISDHARIRHGGDRCTPDEIIRFIEGNPSAVDVYYCPRPAGDVWIELARMPDHTMGLRVLGQDGAELTCFQPESHFYKDHATRGCQYRGTLEMLQGG